MFVLYVVAVKWVLILQLVAACVACVLPQFEGDSISRVQSQLHHQEGRVPGTSPTRHPISAHQVIYELRIYSLEKATFGLVLISRTIRAIHCLTSIQFSPTSEHILLAYGRCHISLLKSIDTNGDASLSIYIVLEVYRVSDMEVVSVLPTAEDEMNVACFHPFSRGGIVYGTKLQEEAPLALKCIDKCKEGGFVELFMTKIDFPTKFDYCMRLNLKGKSEVFY
ncbi:unnamed protein product [Lactuca saligna]|uniref:Uncharacterized protein n=1 Tax=Lactuca saligna TaxID=75948 RepID=A0AA35V097_LACSI|nr:unnamed protein product [Lactuca saligna]